jgi:hypothetical protein
MTEYEEIMPERSDIEYLGYNYNYTDIDQIKFTTSTSTTINIIDELNYKRAIKLYAILNGIPANMPNISLFTTIIQESNNIYCLLRYDRSKYDINYYARLMIKRNYIRPVSDEVGYQAQIFYDIYANYPNPKVQILYEQHEDMDLDAAILAVPICLIKNITGMIEHYSLIVRLKVEHKYVGYVSVSFNRNRGIKLINGQIRDDRRLLLKKTSRTKVKTDINTLNISKTRNNTAVIPPDTRTVKSYIDEYLGYINYEYMCKLNLYHIKDLADQARSFSTIFKNEFEKYYTK